VREIKFRAWNKENKKMDYFHLTHGDSYGIGGDIFPEYEIMQYTGLKDKNGKEIYEGDIMKVLDRDWVDMERDTRTFVVYYAKMFHSAKDKAQAQEDIRNQIRKIESFIEKIRNDALEGQRLMIEKGVNDIIWNEDGGLKSHDISYIVSSVMHYLMNLKVNK